MLERSLRHLIGAAQEPRVRKRCTSRLRGAPHLEDDDGFHLRDLPRRIEELASVLEPLHVNDDDPGFGIAREIGQQICLAHVNTVAVADKLAHTEGGNRGVLQQSGSHRPRLSEYRHRPGLGP